MIQVDNYLDVYFDDICNLVDQFHKEYLVGFEPGFDAEKVKGTIRYYNGEQAKNCFLLVLDGKCVGVLAGMEVHSRVNEDLAFQETFFYVSEPYGKYLRMFIKNVRRTLRARGFNILVMSVLDSDKEHKLINLYKRLGLKYLESHYFQRLD